MLSHTSSRMLKNLYLTYIHILHSSCFQLFSMGLFIFSAAYEHKIRRAGALKEQNGEPLMYRASTYWPLQKINDLRAQYDRSTRILTHSFTAKQRANECSLRVAWILGQHKKKITAEGMSRRA